MQCLKMFFSSNWKSVFKHFFFAILFFSTNVTAQVFDDWFVEGNYYTGSILPHSSQISHLITAKPDGFLLSFNRKTLGEKPWECFYNFPDYGFTLHYQNNHNPELGDLYGAFAHLNFYFFNRNLQFRIAQGIAYATNPYDRDTNFRNLAYGSKFMPSTYFGLNYNKQNIWNGVGFQAGLLFIHHSNATLKAPNISTNTIGLQIGLNYSFEKQEPNRRFNSQADNFNTKMKYVFSFKTGFNEGHVIGMGQKPFYHINFYAEKRLNRTGSVQLGTELFLSQTIKEIIPLLANSFPESNISIDSDYKRISVFTGYELYLNKLSIEGQLGFYVYDQYKINGSIYQRLGLKYNFTDYLFGSLSLKAHSSKAEALEFGIGVKF